MRKRNDDGIDLSDFTVRNYRWWLSKKRRVQKKYTLFLSAYYSPKEAKQLLKRIRLLKRKKGESDEESKNG